MPCSNFQKKQKNKNKPKTKPMFYLVFFQIKQNQTWMRFWDFAERIEKGTETILHNWWSLKKKHVLCVVCMLPVWGPGGLERWRWPAALWEINTCFLWNACVSQPFAVNLKHSAWQSAVLKHWAEPTHTQQCVQKHIIDQIKASRLTVSHKSWPQIRKDQFLFFFLFHSHFLKASTAFFSRPY